MAELCHGSRTAAPTWGASCLKSERETRKETGSFPNSEIRLNKLRGVSPPVTPDDAATGHTTCSFATRTFERVCSRARRRVSRRVLGAILDDLGAPGWPRKDAHLGTQREGRLFVRSQRSWFSGPRGLEPSSTLPSLVVVVTRTVKRTGPATVLGDVVVSCRQCRAGLSSLLSALARRPGHTHLAPAVDRATEMWARHAEGLQEGRLANPAVSRAKSEVDCV